MEDVTAMVSSKPYLFRALYEWIVDSHCTPHIVVDAELPGVDVPRAHVQNGQIVLNVAPSAVGNWSQDANSLGFTARFGGVPHHILVPFYALVGIYARENGRGMMFEAEELPPEPPAPTPVDPKPQTGRPSLRVVK